ncbi:MAG TPA: glycosyltransferase family A protein [Paracoccaceae bacterium]|nr:glycosyltransferase family A protein [Paracoccaceae bacterium]
MIGVVVIGRNEGERLSRCLRSLEGVEAPIVYVDSGSTDGSVALAARFGAITAHLDPAQGFTAGKARNLGVETLLARGDEPPAFVQFVDGDCEVVPGWLEAAAGRLAEAPDLAAVAGRRRERRPEASVFNTLCDMEWNTPPGPARAVGGDAMYRLSAFREVGGFDPSLICGEEPELCLRLARAGWRIERMDREMTLHDAAMTRWSQWAKRAERSGWAFAEGADRFGDGPERHDRREARSIRLWGLAVPAAILAFALLATVLAAAGSAAWPVPALLAAGGALTYPLMALRVAANRRCARGEPWRRALLYGVFTMLAKFPQLRGLHAYHAGKRRGETARIIEYKTPAGGGAR